MSKLTGQFRHSQWDPILIISQIVAMQSVYYVTLGLWIAAVNLLVGTSRSLDHLFKYQEIHVRDIPGKLIIASYVLNSLTGACSLWWLVQRTKQCLDFSCTLHLFHLLACWYYNGHFPASLSWWLLNSACLAIMCICGEFLCMRTELKAIPLNMAPRTDL
ncbi:protein SYS1 homolog [Nilaparvata lugens]|uniref:protein SYS1 homolog n=1 Tax=Nilaparvata lugens TaxID=108931 RepID=UPI00193D51F7|nr:protein SYS1 homolog [Nilaparvata lugens]XP_039291879.1 protein SYS1 homolog [Nilaparvata lugens]